MKSAIAFGSLTAASLAAAAPQNFGNHGGPQNGANGGFQGAGWSGAPSCVSSCWQDLGSNGGSYSDFCTGDKLNTLNSCISSSDCSDDDKEATYQVIAQGCANAGQTPTASQQATFSATSGKDTPSGGPWRGGQGKGDWTTNSNWQSWASANPTPTVTDSAAWSSWASSAGWPTASSEWSSWASANGLPTSVAGGIPFAFGGPGPFSSAVYCLSFRSYNPTNALACLALLPFRTSQTKPTTPAKLTISPRWLRLAHSLDLQLRLRLRPLKLEDPNNRCTRSLRRLGPRR